MKRPNITVLAAIVIGSLLAGTGRANAQSTNENHSGQGRRGPGVEQQLNRMAETLNLTDEQKPKVKAVLEETAKHRGEFANLDQQERRDKMRSLMEEQDKKLKAILTPDQYEKYQKARQERRRQGGAPAGQGGGDKANSPTTKE